LERRSHDVLFLERDVPWYASNRDLPSPPYGRTELYTDLEDLTRRFTPAVGNADFVMVGSYVPEGKAVGEWVVKTAKRMTGFYDIDTPVTLARLREDDCDYLSSDLIGMYDLYLSFTGGPTLELLRTEYGARTPLPLYCSFDPEIYYPESIEAPWDMGYLGTYSDDRQPVLERLMLDAARILTDYRFVVAGPQYPDDTAWPSNVEHIQHLPPAKHRSFYNSQRLTLNVTRRDMVAAGYSPSVRLFEAAACGTPIVSDWWDGLDTFFEPKKEILISRSPADTLAYLRETPEADLSAIGLAARERVLSHHTAAHRAAELEGYIHE
jgi:spore maturation protein CgeB